jgi:hypothetical protein
MNNDSPLDDPLDSVHVDLKNPGWAAFLAWLWPGAGHLYQGRYGKAILFMVCILVTYFWGLAMGDGHVVYASLRKNDIRYPYLLQIGVGLPAMPAMVQSYLNRQGTSLFGSRFMAPPSEPIEEQQHDEKASWHGKLGFYFELGTLFTMVAGLLNVLVIYDAYAGPQLAERPGQSGTPPPDDGHAAKPQPSGLASGLELAGIVLGVVFALSLRAKLELDQRWLSYVFAVGGGVLGAVVSRKIYGLMRRVTQRDAKPSDP